MKTNKLRSIADIAHLAGVDKSTVSRALNNSPLVSAATKERIRAIAERYSFQPSSAARSLSLKSSRTVAFVTHGYGKDCSGIQDLFGLEIMGGIAIGLYENGYDLLVVHVDPEETGWASRYLDSGRVDGFILMTSEHKRTHIDELKAAGAPFIAWCAGTGEFCSVRGDDGRGGFLAGERLAAVGRRRIGFVGGPAESVEVQERLAGWSSALAAAGAAAGPDRVVFGDFCEESAAESVRTLLARDPGLDGVFCCNDLMAIGAVGALRAAGRRVPEDVAVIGYDDLHIAAKVTPALTTVSQRVPLAGKILAADLAAFLRGGPVTTRILPVELVVRASA
jgi:DNA-binding LacI/PurR family transcriptional regulator